MFIKAGSIGPVSTSGKGAHGRGTPVLWMDFARPTGKIPAKVG
jgi:hypothetical protein